MARQLPNFVPGIGASGHPRFAVPPSDYGPVLRITGVTKDSAGAVLPSCTVSLFRKRDDKVQVDETVSDASGNYTFQTVSPNEAYFAVAWGAGTAYGAGNYGAGMYGGSQVAGVTNNTLVGV